MNTGLVNKFEKYQNTQLTGSGSHMRFPNWLSRKNIHVRLQQYFSLFSRPLSFLLIRFSFLRWRLMALCDNGGLVAPRLANVFLVKLLLYLFPCVPNETFYQCISIFMN